MNKNGWGITISCDDCRMQSTSACDDCVVSFLLRDDEQVEQTPLVLDLDQVRVVRLLGKAGLVPDLRYDVAS
ncbi:hypothetical protein BDK89_1491 [Ilumatobacter fluminis]|uniref:Uncharacterized protein n=1 Tax=Ilumatobacter fluminis TaxID=467091 RepID=A0A4R7HYN9_9ACTN|nr:hypothetical protein [Ilumatobacter fluminis]TDT15910.1 hypothetical protein BDK89_1491 [Ilumatobacter fluminis]